ncbi:mono- and diacylglycerol lipase-like [Xenia sp. Carnegie-2017]|uniref:mono- and diacylglycerol lipase-like n=1 Tax=Xenia sp. Carnegie-2017 TaxID=2897299 RepID=UPI001F03A651|nr:mono- and diacylglycerol lipase-like [Xenia sp. Carnegie-2017]
MIFFMQVYQSSACEAPVGHFCHSGRIYQCGKGTYQNRRGKISCKTCPLCTFCLSTGPVIPNKEIYGAPRHLVKIRFAAIKSNEAYTKSKHSYDSQLFENGRMKGFVENTREVIVVSFQGSDGPLDWFRNLKFFKQRYSSCQRCKIHTGFFEAYSPLRDEMLKKVNNFYQEHPKKVLVTGYSLGGAMATLAAVDLVNARYTVDLITFGSSRVGNEEFAKYVDRIVTGLNLRVTYRGDSNTIFPFTGYWHVGQEIHCIGRNKCHVYPAEVDLCHLRANIFDHYMKNYLQI